MRKLLYIFLLLPLLAQGQSVYITTPGDTVCNGLPVTFTAADTGVSVPYYQWTVNGIAAAGADSAFFTTSSLHNGDSIICLLTNSMGDTIIAYSNSIIINVTPFVLPFAGTITGADSIVCVGATITLNDTTAGGEWSAGNNYATVTGGVVTGIIVDQGEEGSAPSKDSIYYTVSNSCGSDTTYRIIGVEKIPYAWFYLGSQYPYGENGLCVGGHLSINTGDGDGGGPAGPMYATNNYISVHGDYITGESPGIDYIYCIATNVCGSDTFGINVTVYPPTTITFFMASSANVCVGSTITTIDSTNGYPSWQASNGNATVNYNGEVTGVMPGIDTIVMGASENNCGHPTASITINVDPPAPITGIDSFCKGAEVRLSDGTTGGIWSSSDTAIIAVDQDGSLKGRAEGGVLISYTFPSSGCIATRLASVYPDYLPLPITGEAEFCLSSVISLSNATSGGRWSSSNSKIAAVDVTGEVSGISAGTATITYALDGCMETKDVTVSGCGNVMSAYPNPSHDEVTIYAFDNIYNAYAFINAIGQNVLQGAIAAPFTNIGIELLPPGFYTIVITGTQNRYISKFVKD